MVRSEQRNAIPERETETQGGQVHYTRREATTVAATLVRRPLMGNCVFRVLLRKIENKGRWPAKRPYHVVEDKGDQTDMDAGRRR